MGRFRPPYLLAEQRNTHRHQKYTNAHITKPSRPPRSTGAPKPDSDGGHYDPDSKLTCLSAERRFTLGRVFKMVLGGPGHWPGPSGDSPDESTSPHNPLSLCSLRSLRLIRLFFHLGQPMSNVPCYSCSKSMNDLIENRTANDSKFAEIKTLLAASATETASPSSPKWGNLESALTGNGLGKRRRGIFAPAGCKRGAHGVTRPTALGARQVLSISLPISDFGLKGSGCRLKGRRPSAPQCF